MTEAEKLIQDYYWDMGFIAEIMESWCDPTPENIAKIEKMQKMSRKALREFKHVKTKLRK